MNTLAQDCKSGEFRNLDDTVAAVQKALNQWKHQFNLDVIAFSFEADGRAKAFVYREPKG